ncbi:hypothetical protein CMT41_08560 [Colwellia sp. MT41]|uniref:hypothetical protein n=1 Tax=Colwellia sp. MT41 TaxID=58049 RepID=UPI0007177987|nr:hypothetical protein [Colwellia sp. MT41]ALO34759.1 hypothetical protein CMT41_08560 [Colwellia sp. MT41]
MSTNKHPLEIGAWLATIISSGIALYFLFPLSNSEVIKVDKPRVELHQQAPSQEKNPSSGNVNKIKQVKSHVKFITEKECSTKEALISKYKLSRTLSTYDKRDSAYAYLIDEYLCHNDFEEAMNIASKLSTYDLRDDNYMKIIKSLVLVKITPLAIELSSKLSTYDKRDEAKRIIINGV